MEKLQKLNFPRITLRAIEREGRTLVYDSIRSAYIVLTPEEWVRRHLVEFLASHCNAPTRSIIEEYPATVNGMAQRADIVVMGSDSKPLLVAECKAPDINLGNRNTLHEVFLQASRYNAVIGARYIVLTNGLRHFCYELTPAGYVSLNKFPLLG